MGAWRRLLDLSKAAVNETLDKLEHPVVMMNQFLRNMEEGIHSAQEELFKESATLRMLEQQIANCHRMADHYDQKAGEAMSNDRMVEARQALEAKLTYLDKAAEYMQAFELSKQRVLDLESQLNQAKAEHASMLAKRENLTERAQKVQVKAQDRLPSFRFSTVDTASAARGFQRMEDTILLKEAQAERTNSMNAAAAAAREALIEEQLTRLRNNVSHQ